MLVASCARPCTLPRSSLRALPAEALRRKVAKGLQRREAPDAIRELQALRADPLASWSLLGDEEFQARILAVLAVAFLPCLYLCSKALWHTFAMT